MQPGGSQYAEAAVAVPDRAPSAASRSGPAACGGQSLEEKAGNGKGGKKGELVIGSAGFTESKVLAEIYSRALADAGYRARVQTLANRELYEPALEKVQLDVVPEYASTLAEFLNAKKNRSKAKPVASSDVDKTVTALKKLAGPRGLKVLPAGTATDQNAFAVTREFATTHKLKTLSDLGKSKQKVKLASGEECETRVFCKPGLEATYGIDIMGLDPRELGPRRPSRPSRTARINWSSPPPRTPRSTTSGWCF